LFKKKQPPPQARVLNRVKLTKLKLEVLTLHFQHKKKNMNADKLAINGQNFAQVRLQLKFAFIIQSFKPLKSF